MVQRTKKLRNLVPGYTMLPKEDYYKVQRVGITADRVRTDPAYDAAREQWEPFRKVVRFQVLLRTALAAVHLTGYPAHGLQRCLLGIINAGKDKEEDARTFLTADLAPLLGFDLYAHRKWKDSVKVPLTTSWDAENAGWEVQIPAFIPAQLIMPPEPMEYVRLSFCQVYIDMEQDKSWAKRKSTGILPLKEMEVRASTLQFKSDQPGNYLHLLVVALTGYRKYPGLSTLFKMEETGPLAIIDWHRPDNRDVN